MAHKGKKIDTLGNLSLHPVELYAVWTGLSVVCASMVPTEPHSLSVSVSLIVVAIITYH